MIRGKIRQAGGFAALNSKIFDFRCTSFQETIEMFNEFAAWNAHFNGENDADDSREFIIAAIRQAAFFIALQCLHPFYEEVNDEDAKNTILTKVKHIIEHFQGEGFELPPGI